MSVKITQSTKVKILILQKIGLWLIYQIHLTQYIINTDESMHKQHFIIVAARGGASLNCFVRVTARFSAKLVLLL